MSGISERILHRLPVSVQNVALSAYGLTLQHNRHAGEYQRYFAQAMERACQTPEDLSRYQDDALSKLLKHAVSSVPYYRAQYNAGLFPIERVTGASGLSVLPVLDKEYVRTLPEQFVADSYDVTKLASISTTGTTGTPLRIFCDANVRRRNYAFHDRFLATVGIDPRSWRATIGGRIVVPSQVRSPPFWRYSYFQKNVLFSSYHLNEDTIETYIRKLKAIRPAYIDSYPSSVYSIARFSRRNGIKLIGITTAIVTSGETLFEEQKAEIEEQFGARVYDQYGCAEMNVLVTSCRFGAYHVHSDFGVLEILKADGTPASDGEMGEVVCTGLINDVMPLIRYQIGDLAIAGQRACKCGSPLPTIERVLGRDDDVIITPRGDRVGRLSPVLKGFPVKEAQYIQDVPHEIRVVLVPDIGFSPEDEARLTHELRLRVGKELGIRYEYRDMIERGRGGKLKSIVSKLPRCE